MAPDTGDGQEMAPSHESSELWFFLKYDKATAILNKPLWIQDLSLVSIVFRIYPFRGQPISYSLSERTICGLARQCIKAFQGLRTALEHPDQLHSAFISLPAVDDEIGRFRGWASNLGVMKTDRSSLDFRLRDVSFLFDNVITLLDSLQISLTEG